VRAKGFIVGLAIAAAVFAAGCGSSGSKEEVGDAQPAKVTPIKGTDLSRVTLSADAAKRLGIATATVVAQGSDRKVIPYDAVIYAADGKIEDAMKSYAEGSRLAPGNDEILFWQAASLWQLGREKDATPIFRKVFAHDRRWVELVPRLVPAGLLKDDPASIKRILALAPGGGRRR